MRPLAKQIGIGTSPCGAVRQIAFALLLPVLLLSLSARAQDQVADSTANLMFGYNISILRLHNYIGQEIMFLAPLQGHEFLSESYQTIELPHENFEESGHSVQFQQYLVKGHMTKAEYEEKKKEYNNSFLLETNIAFPLLRTKNKISLSNLSAQHELLKTDDRKILGECWRIVDIKNLPDPPDEEVPLSKWDKPEHQVSSMNIEFMLEGMKSGTIIYWVVDGNYACRKPNDYQGVYLLPYVRFHANKLKRGARYTLLEDVAMDRTTSGAVFVHSGTELVYGGSKLAPASKFKQGKHPRYMHVFSYRGDSLMLPIYAPLATRVSNGRPGDRSGVGMGKYFQIIPSHLARQVVRTGGKRLVASAPVERTPPPREVEPDPSSEGDEMSGGEEQAPVSKPLARSGSKATPAPEPQEAVAADEPDAEPELDELGEEAFKLTEDLQNLNQARRNRKEPRKAELLKKYGPKFGPLVVSGKIDNGMSAAMVHDAWGTPSFKQSTSGGGAVNLMETYPDFSWVKYRNNKVIGFGGGW